MSSISPASSSPVQTAAAPTPAKPASTGKPANLPDRAADPSALTLSLKGGKVDDVLRKGLKALYGAIYNHDPAAADQAVEKALTALKPAISAAAESGAESIQFRIVTVATSYGDSGSAVTLNGASELGIEAAVVKSGRISPQATGIADLSGNSLGLTPSQISQGGAGGFYRRSQTIAGAGLISNPDLARLKDAQKAFADIQRTTDVLNAFARGNPVPLSQLIKQELSGLV
jgi:hypothetical protein